MLRTDLGGWHEVPITRVHSPECRPHSKLVTALQLAAPQTVSVARDEGMKPTGRARSTGTQAQKWVRSTDRDRMRWSSETLHSTVKRESRERGEGQSRKSYQEQQPGQQAVVQRGNPTTKKTCRLKAGEGSRALQHAIATQRAGEIRHREEAGRNR